MIRICGFSTNITFLKGVKKQDWNSALLMIQKSHITLMLATKNTGRFVDGFVYQHKK